LLTVEPEEPQGGKAMKRMMDSRSLVCMFLAALLGTGSVFAQSFSKAAIKGDLSSTSEQMVARAVEAYGNLPLSFEPNMGQADSRVRFLSRGPGYTLFLTSEEAILAFLAPHGTSARTADRENPTIMRMRLAGANPAPTIFGAEELPGKSNYFIGNDPNRWRTEIPNYAKVRYHAVYPGIDLLYYGNQGRVEYDFVVAAGSDSRAIKLAFEQTSRGANPRVDATTPLRIDQSGDLLMWLDGNEVRLHKPTAYQLTTDHGTGVGGRHLVNARYVLRSDGQVGIRLAPYDATRAVIIDPVLTYATRLGGSSGVINAVIAADAAGNVYVSGTTGAFDFPVLNQIPGACQGTCSTSFETVYVTKINAAGNALVYSSLIGGSTLDEGFGIAVDGLGNAYLSGSTSSSDFPQVNPIPGACVGTCGTGAGDAFVTKVSAAGDALVYSSLLGGSNNDSAFAVAVDGSGDAYVTGSTDSTDFPQVNPIPGACLGTCGTSSFPQNAFVTEINAAGNAFIYSSYLAGSGFTEGFGIAADSAGNAYVTGVTISSDFPRINQIAGICSGTCGTGSSDGFVTKISAQGTAVAYSSLFGGSGFDIGFAIAVDGAGNAYLTGTTESTDFPQINPIKKACSKGCGNGLGDAFVIKINSAGSAAAYSSLLGGDHDDEGTGIAVNTLGSVYVSGFTKSPNFPSVRPIRGACLGTCGKAATTKVFAVNVSAGSNGLVYSTLIGGSDTDEGQGIALDASGNAYLTGFTQSADFPIVKQIPGACVGSCGSPFHQDTFIVKVAP
jgi:hypothetical protein